jgi:uncharacterized integral membrane protein
MRTLRWLIAVALLLGTGIAGVGFVLGNGDEVRLALPFFTPRYEPLWLVIVAAFFAGAFAASAGLLFQLGRKSFAMRRSEKRVKGLEAELAQLRAAAPAIAVGDGAPPISRSGP